MQHFFRHMYRRLKTTQEPHKNWYENYKTLDNLIEFRKKINECYDAYELEKTNGLQKCKNKPFYYRWFKTTSCKNPTCRYIEKHCTGGNDVCMHEMKENENNKEYKILCGQLLALEKECVRKTKKFRKKCQVERQINEIKTFKDFIKLHHNFPQFLHTFVKRYYLNFIKYVLKRFIAVYKSENKTQRENNKHKLIQLIGQPDQEFQIFTIDNNEFKPSKVIELIGEEVPESKSMQQEFENYLAGLRLLWKGPGNRKGLYDFLQEDPFIPCQGTSTIFQLEGELKDKGLIELMQPYYSCYQKKKQ